MTLILQYILTLFSSTQATSFTVSAIIIHGHPTTWLLQVLVQHIFTLSIQTSIPYHTCPKL